MLLRDLKIVSECEECKGPKFEMTEHIRQFTNPELMRQYGRLLEEFEQNTPFVNDSSTLNTINCQVIFKDLGAGPANMRRLGGPNMLMFHKL